MRNILVLVAYLLVVTKAVAFEASRCEPDQFNVMFSDARVKACEDYAATPGLSGPDRARAFFYLGEAYSTKERPGEPFPKRMNRVIDTWLAAIEADKAYAEPYLAAGRYMVQGGSAFDGLRKYEEAERVSPFDWRVYAGKAYALLALHRDDDALRTAQMAISLAPGSKFAMQAYGLALSRMGLHTEAATAYLAARRPYNKGWPEQMGLLQEFDPWPLAAIELFKAGKPAQAAQQMREQIAALDPKQIQFYDYASLANYEEAAGDYRSALADLRKAVTMPGVTDIDALKNRISLLAVKAGHDASQTADIAARIEHGDLHQILVVQVFLKNNGFDRVDINGTYDDVTRGALKQCVADAKCAAGLGKQI